MNAQDFRNTYAADKSMTRKISVILVETGSGYLLARADGPAGIAYAASRTTSKAIGRASSAAAYGDYAAAEAYETPGEALDAAVGTVDYH